VNERDPMAILRTVFYNRYSHEAFSKPVPTDNSKIYDGSVMISETDLEGVITYTNKKFRNFVGYEKREIVGLPHNIIRHPDMPEGLFYAMWKIIRQKKVWRGYVKSLCRDGSHFWALVYIQPKLDAQGKHIGYVANRKNAYASSIEEVEKKYAELLGPEHKYDPYFETMELYHGDELATFVQR